jgi:hypothetical protein
MKIDNDDSMFPNEHGRRGKHHGNASELLRVLRRLGPGDVLHGSLLKCGVQVVSMRNRVANVQRETEGSKFATTVDDDGDTFHVKRIR